MVLGMNVLITGTSHNLRTTLALQFIKKGYNVWATYSNQEDSGATRQQLITDRISAIELTDPTDQYEVANAVQLFGGPTEDQPLDILVICSDISAAQAASTNNYIHKFYARTWPDQIITAFRRFLERGKNPRVVHIVSDAAGFDKLSHPIDKKTVTLAKPKSSRQLSQDGVAFVTLDAGSGDLECTRAAKRMIFVIEALTFNDDGTLWHRDGYQINLDQANVNRDRACLNASLRDARRKIHEICYIARVVGTCVLVIDNGDTVFRDCYGDRNVHDEPPQPMTPDTIVPIACLTKSFTGICLNKLHEEGKLSFNDLISKHLPLSPNTGWESADSVTIADLLAHRTGVREGHSIWSGMDGEVLLNNDEIKTVFRHLMPQDGPRPGFSYCNLGYAILGDIIAAVSGQPYHEYVQKNILDPLKMTRTLATSKAEKFNKTLSRKNQSNSNVEGADMGDKEKKVSNGISSDSYDSSQTFTVDNRASAYTVRGDDENFIVDEPGITGSGPMGAAGGILSTANDLAKYYKALMKSWQAQSKKRGKKKSEYEVENEKEEEEEEEKKTKEESPFCGDVTWLFAPLQTIETPTFREKSYAMGWVRSQLPGTVGDFGDNVKLVRVRPVLAEGILQPPESRLAFWHQASLVGATHFVMLLPETESAVIVLTNTSAFVDAADWIGQLLVEVLLAKGRKPVFQHDYLKLARESLESAYNRQISILHLIDIGRSKEGPKRPLRQYVGTYVGFGKAFSIRIVYGRESLHMFLQGSPNQIFELVHHHDDVFTWGLAAYSHPHWKHIIRHGPTPFYIYFMGGNSIGTLNWVQDPIGRPEGELFFKEGVASGSK